MRNRTAPTRQGYAGDLTDQRAPGKRALTDALSPRGGGALDPGIAAAAGAALGQDVSSVRVHQDGQAEALGTRAFAQGEDVHFAAGAYDPTSAAGRAIIGHELTHVVQQRAGRVAAEREVGGVAVNTDRGLEREADRGGEAVAQGFDLDTFFAGFGGARAPGPATTPVAQGLDLGPRPDDGQTGTSVSPADADAGLQLAELYMNLYGRGTARPAPPALAAPLAAIFEACNHRDLPVAQRRRRFDDGVAALASARAVASARVVARYDEAIPTIHAHFAIEEQADTGAGGDPVLEALQLRSTGAQVAAMGSAMAQLIDAANAKRLAAIGKTIKWTELGELVSDTKTQYLGKIGDEPALITAYGLFAGAGFEAGFAALDSGLTAWAAAGKLGDEDVGVKMKAAVDLVAAVLKGIGVVGKGAMTEMATTATTAADAGEWMAAASSFGKSVGIVTGGLGGLASAIDLVNNALKLWNAKDEFQAVDAVVGMAGATASMLASGTKALVDAGLIAEAGLAAEIMAIATPLAIAIPATWLLTKAALLEMGRLRLAITGAMMAEAFERLTDDGRRLATETEQLCVALVSASTGAAEAEIVVRDRVPLVREAQRTLVANVTGQRARVLTREVATLVRAAGIDWDAATDAVTIAVAARTIVAGISGLLERSPELVAEEAGDPTFATTIRAGQGAGVTPADGADDGTGAPPECDPDGP